MTDESGDRPVIVDASMAITWCISAESTEATDRMLIAVARSGMIVPAIWWLEVANALVMARRRERLGSGDWTRFEEMLSRFKIETEPVEPIRVIADTARLSQSQRLTVYDASYLELAIRRNAQLATLDKVLIGAADNAGLPLFNP